MKMEVSNPKSGSALYDKRWAESISPYPVSACSTPPVVLTQKAHINFEIVNP